MIKTFITNNIEETYALGEKLAKVLPCGSTILMNGDLGSGKTTLVRGIARGLHINEVVQSPTFNIMKLYLKGDKHLIHIDAYRLNDINIDIGLEEYIGDEHSLTMIEWPNFIEKYWPLNPIILNIEMISDSSRKYSFEIPDELGDII